MAAVSFVLFNKESQQFDAFLLNIVIHFVSTYCHLRTVLKYNVCPTVILRLLERSVVLSLKKFVGKNHSCVSQLRGLFL